jgi:hypothetical protein
MARVVTKPVLSDTILRSVEKAVSRMCQEGVRTKRKIKHGKERNLLVDKSAKLGQQG